MRAIARSTFALVDWPPKCGALELLSSPSQTTSESGIPNRVTATVASDVASDRNLALYLGSPPNPLMIRRCVCAWSALAVNSRASARRELRADSCELRVNGFGVMRGPAICDRPIRQTEG